METGWFVVLHSCTQCCAMGRRVNVSARFAFVFLSSFRSDAAASLYQTQTMAERQTVVPEKNKTKKVEINKT